MRGALVLAACADALGAPFEGRPAAEPARIAAIMNRPSSPLRWTDDTAQMLVLAAHLAECTGEIRREALAAALARAWEAEPGRGYGMGAVRVLSQVRSGVPWQRAAASVFGGAGSWGNGAAMRVAPVGLVAGLSLDDIARAAAASAQVTHAHQLGIDGAVVQAVAVAVAARTSRLRRLAADDLIAVVAQYARTPEFTAELRSVPGLLEGAASDIAARFACDATALGSVPAAIAVFLRHPDEPADAIAEAIGLGGDTDTIAAMTGALAGARCGEGAIPASWALRLEQSMRVWTVAGQLSGLGQRR
ncbi:ADP-ribosylglycohydrolase family protein [Glycomyces sp. L485]|uniref:ADP-ribosylglycohydrolase family protein n=1 Tax=Glycomyces sp. L485 TaxID=2909235 RepID=UPI001F4B0A0A|nr:ADP-ribosylglycohydrolase family protein [Glycomyces sp. L485]